MLTKSRKKENNQETHEVEGDEREQILVDQEQRRTEGEEQNQKDAEEEGTEEGKSTIKMTEIQKMMGNKVTGVGDPGRPPKAGDVIQYLNKDGGWEKVTVTSRYSRKSGYVNVKERGPGTKAHAARPKPSLSYDEPFGSIPAHTYGQSLWPE